jgi:hypothetical protein
MCSIFVNTYLCDRECKLEQFLIFVFGTRRLIMVAVDCIVYAARARPPKRKLGSTGGLYALVFFTANPFFLSHVCSRGDVDMVCSGFLFF